MHDMVYFLLVGAGLIAGFIDAIVGGGGLLSVPALIATGLPPHTVLGTNKLAASIGVLSSTLVYLRKNIYNIKLWLFVVYAAIFGGACGTIIIHFVSANWLEKLIPLLLLLMVIYMAIPKNLANKGQPFNYQPPKLQGGILGVLIGFYDGFFGPGTGSFWTTALLYFFKLDLIQATAIAKLMNFASNITAAIIFACYGSIHYSFAFVLMLGYIVGSYAGAHSAIKHGKKLIKPVFLIVVTLIAMKMLGAYWF